MSNFALIGLAGIDLDLTHPMALLTVATIVAVWVLASLLVRLPIGRASYLFGPRQTWARQTAWLRAPGWLATLHQSYYGVKRRESRGAPSRARLSFPFYLALIAVLCLTPGAAASTLLSASPYSLSFGGVAVGRSATLGVTLTNTGTSSVTISQATESGAGFSLSPPLSLPLTLAAGQSTTLNITFAPTTPNGFSGTASVVSNASNSPANFKLSGMGAACLLTASPTSLAFGNLTVNSTSTDTVTLTNSGPNTLRVSQATVTGAGFTLSAPSLPVTLTAGQSTTLYVNFAPTTLNTETGSLSIVSTAPNSPSAINLSGTGMPDPPCVGTTINETPTDVTAAMSSVAPGITVTQLTNNGFNWNTYADYPTYSLLTNVLVYNYGTSPAAVASANLDGTNAQVVSASRQGTQAQVTIDGKFVYYQGQNSNNTADIYAVPLSQPGACQPLRLSQRNMRPIPPAPALMISTSSLDPATQKNVIAFSEGSILHRVLDDGTALPDLTLGDPENANDFHRLRLNPVFPNVMWYKRDQPLPNPNAVALPEIWIVDLNSPNTVYSLAGSANGVPLAVDHPSWSNDGTKLGFIYQGYWWVANVLNPDGTFNFNASDTKIGPPASSGYCVDFCTLSPDGSAYVCAYGYKSIYLMSPDGKQTKFLANSDASSTGKIYNGIPKPRFLDMQHIIFSSDKTGLPEVYVLTGFTTTFP